MSVAAIYTLVARDHAKGRLPRDTREPVRLTPRRGGIAPRAKWHNAPQCVLLGRHIHIGAAMRTNIDIDDLLLNEAMAAAGLPTKKATVEEALRRLVLDHRRKRAIVDMAGLGWVGDLDASRKGRG